MPGMLTAEEMATLADASGAAFDRLFLEGMIKHHGGALTMVRELFATAGAGQESDIFAFASDVDADQRMEIERMTENVEGAAAMRAWWRDCSRLSPCTDERDRPVAPDRATPDRRPLPTRASG